MSPKQSRKTKSSTLDVTRWRASMFPVLLLLTLLLTGFLLVRNVINNPHWFPLQVVEVKGEFSHLDRSHLEQVVAGVMRGGFFAVDIQQIQQAVQTLPWVYRVSIRRRWPDKLVMQVEEQIQLANWTEDALVNLQGEIFRPDNKDPKISLVLFGADEEANEVVDLYREVSEQTIEQGFTMTRFGKDLHRDWVVEFDNGLKITMGRDHASEKLQRFFALLPAISTAGKQAQIVDLRYEQGFSILWMDVPVDLTQDEAA